jgi:hypothetical protein
MKYKCRKFKEGERCPLVPVQKAMLWNDPATGRRVYVSGFTHCSDHACYLRKRKKYTKKTAILTGENHQNPEIPDPI